MTFLLSITWRSSSKIWVVFKTFGPRHSSPYRPVRAPIFISASTTGWGRLVESGLVAPIDLGAKRDDFVESTLEAFTYTDGNLYGMPYATENLGFFYNTELVPEPPTTWDEVLEIARALKAEGKVEYAIAVATGPGYNALPIQTAFGGYVFGVDENGAWNPDDVGLDSEGDDRRCRLDDRGCRRGPHAQHL